MRSVLTWVVFGVLPSSEDQWFISTALKLIVFPLWFAGVVFFSKIWSIKLDGWAGSVAQWAEDVMMGKKNFSDSIYSAMPRRIAHQDAKEVNGNGHITDLKVSEKDKYIV
jgi:hypothetical protein